MLADLSPGCLYRSDTLDEFLALQRLEAPSHLTLCDVRPADIGRRTFTPRFYEKSRCLGGETDTSCSHGVRSFGHSYGSHLSVLKLLTEALGLRIQNIEKCPFFDFQSVLYLEI